MLLNSNRLLNYPVLSLHLGGPIGVVKEVIINPNDLKIMALRVDGPQTGDGEHGDLLNVSNIREFSNLGIIIDSIDDLVSDGDVVKLDEVIKLNFDVIGLNVRTKKGNKLGKVFDYTFNPESMLITQFIVKRPLLKAFLDPELVIGRSEIKEINDYELIVKDEEEKIKKDIKKQDFVPNFVNPFREGEFVTSESNLELEN
jgi:hypothetical protein